MTHQNPFRTMPALIGVAMGLAALTSGCAQQNTGGPRVDMRTEDTAYRNEVVPTTVQTQVRFMPGDFGAMAPDETAKLDSFLAGNAVTPAAHAVLTTPGSVLPAQAVRDRLVAHGLQPSNVVIARGGSYGRGSVQVVDVRIDQYHVNVPQCGSWPAMANFESTLPNLGCSNVRALGLMVADPHDLVAGRSATGVDGAVQAAAIERYRTDKTTPLSKDLSFQVQ